jgi:uncharacterized protein DUF1737
MKKITQYTVITELGTEKFIQVVNDAIEKGWQPMGGVTAFQVSMPTAQGNFVGIEYVQALVAYGDAIDIS